MAHGLLFSEESSEQVGATQIQMVCICSSLKGKRKWSKEEKENPNTHF